MSLRKFFGAAAVLALTMIPWLVGCSGSGSTSQDANASHGHDHSDEGHAETMALTGWSADLEVFAEVPQLIAKAHSHLYLHLTRLPGGEPVGEGPVRLLWTGEDGQTAERIISDPEQPGVFVLEVDLPQAGHWSLKVMVDPVSEPVVLENIYVAASAHDDHHHQAPPVPEGEDIVHMSKEQQWLMGVASAPVQQKTFTQPLRVAARIEAPPAQRVIVTSPVSGRLGPMSGSSLPVLGQKVTAGQPLLALQVQLTGDAGEFIDAEAQLVTAAESLRLAEAELSRATQLHQAGAASARRVEEARAALAQAKARQVATQNLLQGAQPVHSLVAPIDGIIVAQEASPGQYVEAGQSVITILDPSTVWVRGHIPETALENLPARPQARLGIHGDVEDACHIEGAELVYLAPEIDTVTRTAAVVYSVDNHDMHLRPGQTLGLALNTNTTTDGLVVPVEALVDEHGQPVIFVQTNGETFSKRYVTLGGQDGAVALVDRGIAPGDRIVIKAPWAVKLASVSTTAPGHGHAH